MCSPPLRKHPQTRQEQGWPLQLLGVTGLSLSTHSWWHWWSEMMSRCFKTSPWLASPATLMVFLYLFTPFHTDVFPLESSSYFWSYLNNPPSACNFTFRISVQHFSRLVLSGLGGGYAAVAHQSSVVGPGTWSEKPWLAGESLQQGLQRVGVTNKCNKFLNTSIQIYCF